MQPARLVEPHRLVMPTERLAQVTNELVTERAILVAMAHKNALVDGNGRRPNRAGPPTHELFSTQGNFRGQAECREEEAYDVGVILLQVHVIAHLRPRKGRDD